MTFQLDILRNVKDDGKVHKIENMMMCVRVNISDYYILLDPPTHEDVTVTYYY